MDISRSTFILEEKINDLENHLNHKSQALKTKENVLHLQQEQIKKLEEMYKKSLEEYAIISGEHKKTINDLENLRIILKSYETKQISICCAQTQVDWTSSQQEKCRINTETTTEKGLADFQRIRQSVELQNQKADRIIQLLNDATTNQLNNIRAHIEDLQACTQTLVAWNQPQNRNTNVMFPIAEVSDQTLPTKYKVCTLDSVVAMMLENGCQTNIITIDAWTNIPYSLAVQACQAEVAIAHFGFTTETPRRESKITQSEAQIYPSISLQNSLFDDIVGLKSTVDTLMSEVDIFEGVYNKFAVCIGTNKKLIDDLQEKETQLAEMMQKCQLQDALIERTSVLTTQEITEMCRKITLQTTENYGEIIQENTNLKAKIEMLNNEADNLKLHNTDISRVVVELNNVSMQTEVCLLSLSADEYRKQVVELSDELATAYITIKSLQNKLSQFESNSESIEHLKEIFLKTNAENAQFYNIQLSEVEKRHSERTRVLEEQIMDMQKVGDEDHRLSVLKMENSELCQVIYDLRHDLELAKISQNSADDLKLMCLKLGQNLSDTNFIKQENMLLKNKIDSRQEEVFHIETHYNQEIQSLAQELHKLKAENLELSEGINQLKLVVQINTEKESLISLQDKARTVNISLERESSPDTSSEEMIPCSLLTNRKNSVSSDLGGPLCLIDSMAMKIKAEELEINAGDKCILNNLEQDIRILTKEFVNFKISSQTEHQQLAQKHADLLAHKDELINCLNQYKTVNENLLQSHYELEKSKNISATQHQQLLEDYLKLQDELQAFLNESENKRDHGDCTILSLRDLRELDHLKIENVDLQNLNLKLRQEIQNLVEQLQSDQLRSVHKRHTGTKCSNCEKLVSENLQLKNVVLQKEEDLSACLNKYENLQTEINQTIQVRDELIRIRDVYLQSEERVEKLVNQVKGLTGEKERLLADIAQHEIRNKNMIGELSVAQSELKNALMEKESTNEPITELSKSKNHLKILTDEKENLQKTLETVQANLKNSEAELKRSEDEIAMLHKVINKITAYKEKFYKLEAETTELKSELLQKNMAIRYNESLQEDYKKLAEQLKSVTESKEKVDLDFESYIRTNNLLQATMNTQNCNLSEELRIFQSECERLRTELGQLEGSNSHSKSEYLRVVNECDNYKNQLENMTKRIDCHLREHIDYREEMEAIKKKLEVENSNLKQLVKASSRAKDKFNIKNYQGSKGIADLESFINNKEVEIDFLMGQKLEAMSAMGALVGVGKKLVSGSDDTSVESGEEFKVQLNFKKAPQRDISSSRTVRSNKSVRSTSEPRAIQKMLWDKDQKSATSAQVSNRARKITSIPVKKK